MRSYYLTTGKARTFDATMIAAIIAAFGVTDAAVAADLSHRVNYRVDTDAGLMTGSIYLSEDTHSPRLRSHGWLHARFADVEKAKTVLPSGPVSRLNPYSGKYNFHFTGDDCASQFFFMVRELHSLNPRNLVLA